MTLNPVNRALLARSANKIKDWAKETTSDEDIIKRLWLFIDLDPKRPSGISATGAEKEAAIKVAADVREWLMTEFQFCEPVEVDSGNGRYLLWPIDLPNDKSARDLISHVLKAVHAHCGTEAVTIDTTVSNASRIIRLPGTLNRKGDNIPDRPHRRAALVSVPDALRAGWSNPLSREQLEAVAKRLPERQPPERLSSSTRGEAKEMGVVERVRRYLSRIAPAVSGERGHTQTLLAAQHIVRGFELSDDEAWPLLLEWNQTCQPPWDESELRHKLSEARNNGTAVEWGQHLRDDARFSRNLRGDGDTSPQNTDRTDLVSPGNGESELMLPPFVPFPTDLLPDPIGEFIRKSAIAMGCDEAYIALPLLTGLAAAVGGSRRIRLKRSWCEPCVLWTVIVGESGTMKSPALAHAVEMLRAREHAAMRRHRIDMDQHELELLRSEAAFAQWKRHGHKTLEPPPQKPDAPPRQRWIVEDATVESLAPILAENPRGLLVVRDELSGWVNSFDGYKATRGADVAHWLSMHRAGSLVVDRKTGQRCIHVARAAVSVTGGIQPATLVSALGGRGVEEVGGPQPSAEHIENGLAARLLMARPPKKAKRWTDADVSESLMGQVDAIFETLCGLEFQQDEHGDYQPVDLPLSPSALETWIAFYNQHAIETVNHSGPTAAAWSKLEGYAARFGLLIHLLQQAIGHAEDVISQEAIENGIALSQWFGHETRRIYAELGIDFASAEEMQHTTAKRLVSIAQQHGGALTVRQLMRSCRQYRSSADDAEQALRVAAGLGYFFPVVNTSTGGRPVEEWVLCGDTTPEIPAKSDLVSPSPEESHAHNGKETPC